MPMGARRAGWPLQLLPRTVPVWPAAAVAAARRGAARYAVRIEPAPSPPPPACKAWQSTDHMRPRHGGCGGYGALRWRKRATAATAHNVTPAFLQHN